MSSSQPPLGSVPTGTALAVRLAGLDVRATPDMELLDALSAASRQLAYQQAQVWSIMAELATRNPLPNLPAALTWSAEQVFDAVVEEIRAELRLTRRGATAELQRAVDVHALPPVARALAAGRIDRARAVVLAEGCADLTRAQQAKLLAAVLPGADRVTVTGLAARVKRVAMALDPGWAERRYREAIRTRRVISYLSEDGSATITAQGLPADEAALACARVAALADAAKRAGAHAPIDHLRAELFLGLLDGRFHHLDQAAMVRELCRAFPKPDVEAPEGDREPAAECAAESAVESAVKATRELARESAAEPSTQPSPEVEPDQAAGPVAGRVGVELRVELSTMLGLDEHPGEIAGWGPVPAPVARELAETQRHGEWRFAITDDRGRLLFDGITRHRPRRDKSRTGPPVGGEGNAGPRMAGGIVELHVPARLLADPDLPDRFPAWRRLLADLARQYCDRRPIEQDPAARFPGRPLRRHSQIRHRTCLFPGCRRPVTQADQDHRHEHARGGPTTADNLAPGCRHDHRLKTTGGWRLIKRDHHTYLWISPLGRTHHVDIDPITVPLPEPLPRPLQPEPVTILDEHGSAPGLIWASPTAERPRPTSSPTQGDPDPPPF